MNFLALGRSNGVNPEHARRWVDATRKLDAGDRQGKVVGRAELMTAAQLTSEPKADASSEHVAQIYQKLLEDGVDRQAPPIPYEQAVRTLSDYAGRGQLDAIPAQIPSDTQDRMGLSLSFLFHACRANPLGTVNGADPTTLKDFLERYGLEKPHREGKAASRLVDGFIYDFLWRYQKQSPEDLKQEQQASLSESLAHHGAQTNARDAYAVLAMLSKQNVQRLESAFPYQAGKPEMKRAEEILAKVELRLTHNTVKLNGMPMMPLISAHQLEKVGAKGRNTATFNKDFLGTADNVYWFADMAFPDAKLSNHGFYGTNGVELDKAYAAEHAFVSVFIMYVRELLQLAQNQFPDLYKKFSQELESAFRRNGFFATCWPRALAETQCLGIEPGDDVIAMAEWARFSDNRFFRQAMTRFLNSSPTLLEIRNRLADFDFTPQDFEAMARRQMLYDLDALRQKNPQKFESTLDALEFGKGSDFQSLWKETRSRLGLPTSQAPMEGKVPVAVPVSALSQAF